MKLNFSRCQLLCFFRDWFETISILKNLKQGFLAYIFRLYTLCFHPQLCKRISSLNMAKSAVSSRLLKKTIMENLIFCVWSRLLKKLVIENFIFYEMQVCALTWVFAYFLFLSLGKRKHAILMLMFLKVLTNVFLLCFPVQSFRQFTVSQWPRR